MGHPGIGSSSTRHGWGSLVLIGAILGSCVQTPAPDTTTTTTTPSVLETTTTTEASTTTEPEPFVYRIGLVDPPTTDNFWAYFDPQSSLADRYLLGSTKTSLYEYDPPAFTLSPALAATEGIPAPVEVDEGWEVVVDLKPDAIWSDGVPMTADDIVFTLETVRDLDLGQGWSAAYPIVDPGGDQLGLVDVEAVDADTVRFLYNGRPGLPYWPNGPGTAPIMPRHFWGPIVVEALTTDNPAAALADASGAGEPSGGPIVVTSIGPDGGAATPNPNWVRLGDQVTSGDVSYQLNPAFEEMTFTVFDGQAGAGQALLDDQIDVILSANGLDPQLAGRLGREPGVEIMNNQVNGFRYLAFNLRRPPMLDPALRNALELMNDREMITEGVFGGRVDSAVATIPTGNAAWFDQDVVAEFRDSTEDLTNQERLDRAVAILTDAGYTWETLPTFEANGVRPGVGIMLDGEPVRAIDLLAPSDEFDPLRSSYALWIQRWLTELGFSVNLRWSDFATLVDTVFTPVEDRTDINFDMVILGWRLPSPAIPVHHGSFFASNNDTLIADGNNNTGFADARFDAFVQEYNGAVDAQSAYDIVWEMEKILYEQKPYLVLFDTEIHEAYRSDRVSYPFTQVLSGIQSLGGLPAVVEPVTP